MQLFTHSYLNDYNILSKAVIGFELEFYSIINYPRTLELLNRELYPITVHGFREYHSKFETDKMNFKLELDLSGGFSMAELITGPLPYAEARITLTKILKIFNQIANTTDRSSIHINISFTDKNISNINVLKFILNVDESQIYLKFPDRERNVYAKSIKNIIPYKDINFANSDRNIINGSLVIPQSKYYGTNFGTINKGRLEIRYLGGENYHKKTDDILDFLDYFILLAYNTCNAVLNDAEMSILQSYLEERIKKYNSITKLSNFIANFPNIRLEVDKQNNLELIESYYSHICGKLFDFLNACKSIDTAIINFDTETKNIEIVDAEIEFLLDCGNIDIISCDLTMGDLSEVELISCSIKNSNLYKCNLIDCEVIESKLDGCKVDSQTKLTDTYFTDGLMDGNMVGGVFRSGKLGDHAILSPETKVMNDDNNFFNLKKGKNIETNKKQISDKKL